MASARHRSNGLRSAEEFASTILDDPNYRTRLKARAQAGELAPQVEVALMHYRWGKPVEQLNVAFDEDLTNFSKEDLMKLAGELQNFLRDLPDDHVSTDIATMPAASDKVQ